MKVMTWKSTLPETKIALANSPLKVAGMIFLFHGICKLPGKSQVPPMYSERIFFHFSHLYLETETNRRIIQFFFPKKRHKINFSLETNLQPFKNQLGKLGFRTRCQPSADRWCRLFVGLLGPVVIHQNTGRAVFWFVNLYVRSHLVKCT